MIDSKLIRVIALSIVVAATGGLARAAEGGPPPYQADLQRLAEILGALHYLRSVCGANEGQTWRNEMQALIDAEAPPGERRDRLVASLSRLSADLSQLHAGRRSRGSTLPRRGRQNLARHHRAVRQLTSTNGATAASFDDAPKLTFPKSAD